MEEIERARKVVKLALIRIGIRCDLSGFAYLCYAIELVIQEPKLINNLCKGLYPKVAEMFPESKKYGVERSIRHAIEDAYLNKGFEELNRMFNTKICDIDYKPVSGELIRLVAEYYNLGLYKKDMDF